MSPLTERRLDRIVGAFPRVTLLVVGDVMLDEYLWGDVERVSQEAPVPIVHVRRESIALGGAGNVVRNVVGLGGACACAATVGEDSAGRLIADLLKDHGADSGGIVAVPGRPTTRKTRVEARSQQIVRFDRETTAVCWSAAWHEASSAAAARRTFRCSSIRRRNSARSAART
jgi:D-beta-D-heptose 7-phosphate kinase/D-beta-D-heptose 1-phosphate adenosyltransferase